MDDTQTLQQAITAIKNGDRVTGQKLLVPLVKANPNHEIALLWLAATIDDMDKRRQCLERVLTINPNNEAAKRGLAGLQQKQVSQPKQVDLPKVEPPPPIQPSEATASQQIINSEVEKQSGQTLEPTSQPSTPLKPLKAIKREATKKCPYCAETIKAEANVCRFCGRDLKTGEQTSQPPKVIIQQTPQKQKKRNPIVTFLAALGLMSLLCVCLGIIFMPSSPRSTPKYNLLGTQGQFHFVVVDKGLDSDRSALKSIADAICKGQTVCIVFFWDDNSKAASSLPMTDAQVNAKVAQYNLNKNTDLDRLLICASDGC